MPSLTRRALLRSAAVSALVVPLGTAALTSCSTEPSPEEKLAGRLAALASAALASASAARQLKASAPGQAAALDEIATIRDRHATLLRDEINRLHSSSAALINSPSTAAGPTAPGTSAAGGTGASETSPVVRPPNGAASIDGLRASLTTDATAARQVATTADGFVAGLAASVSASITSLTGLLS